MHIHSPVMVEQVLEYMDIKGNDLVVDCTLGEGGHSARFLEYLEDGLLLGIEQDQELLERAVDRFKRYKEKFIAVKDNFVDLKQIVKEKIGERVNKIFFDLGASMYHFKESGRGFSFLKEEPLDMRMDRSKPLKAEEVVNRFERSKLAKIVWAYGEERFSNRIAGFIEREREKKQITTSRQLADIVKRAIPRKFWPKKIHPATKTFQALRIFINDEIDILETALRDAVELLRPDGRICVISFHSLEDRIVKTVFKELSRDCSCPPDFPICMCGGKKVIKILTKKPLLPDASENQRNPSCRSARLRCVVKLKNGVSNDVSQSMGASA